MSSNVSSAMESIAISYTFDRKTKTVTEITIKDIDCREESSGCAEVLKLANKQNIVFKTSKILTFCVEPLGPELALPPQAVSPTNKEHTNAKAHG